MEADIAGCFDNIDHDWLINNIPLDKQVLLKWLKAGVVFEGKFQSTTSGTPQGGIISPTLANMALNGLEDGLRQYLKGELGSVSTIKQKINVTRYADDFVITGDSKEVLAHLVRPWIESFLAERGLSLSQEKTQITHIDDGFDFLGWNFRKYGGKLLIKPSKKNVAEFYSNIREAVGANKAVTQFELIRLLNLKLRGWTLYHRHVVAKETFNQMRYLVFGLIWRWSLRCHPNKPKTWIKRRYFQMIENRQWVFATPYIENGAVLYDPARIPIKRHIKIMADYNPYDLEWEMYGELRQQKRLADKMQHRRDWSSLYKSQSGKCALCGDMITSETGWHDHHIVYRAKGGSNALRNRVLLHPTCHYKVHRLVLTVVKPAPVKRSLQ